MHNPFQTYNVTCNVTYKWDVLLAVCWIVFRHDKSVTVNSLLSTTFTFTYPLTARVVWAPRWLLNPFSPFPPLFSIAVWDLTNSRPVYSLMLSSHLLFCLPCLVLPFTVPCNMVLARPDDRETWPYHCCLLLFTMVRKSWRGPIACWTLARASSLLTWSLYEMRSILR